MTNVTQLRPKQSLRLQCSACGATAEAACNCRAPYLPPGELAAKGVAENPTLSDEAISAQLGIGRETVRRARDAISPNGEVKTNTRIGRDGTERVLPQPRKPRGDPAPRFDEDTLSQADSDRGIVLIAERLDSGLFLPSPGILACLKEAMARASPKHRKAIEEAAHTLSELLR